MWEEDGIFRFAYSLKAEVALDDAKENIAAQSKLVKEKKLPGLIDMTEVKSVNREARAYYASEEAVKLCSAIAILIATPISRVIGNLFLGLNTPPFPTKLFTSKAEAVEWLKGFLE